MTPTHTGTANGDRCPKCFKDQMPKWTGKSTARACQACGFIEEREPKPDVAE